MHHFAYRDGVLHAEDVNLKALAEEIGTPFYCYSTRHAGAPLQGDARCLRRHRSHDLLCHEGQFQPGRDPHHGGTGRRHGRGLRRRTAPRAGGGRSRPQDRVLRRRQDGARNGAGAEARASPASTSNPSPNSNCCPRWPSAWASAPPCRSASIRMSMPRPTTRSRPARPRTSSAFPTSARREVYARAAELPAIDVAGIDMHIGSQITELEPFEKAFRLMAELTRGAAGGRPQHPPPRSGRRPRRSLSRHQ